MTDPLPWQAWCDACARPNPGHIGLGVVLHAPDGERHELSRRSPQQGCNNEAEGLGLLATLEFALNLGARNLCVHCDSDVIVRLALDENANEALRLAPLFEEIRSLAAMFASLELKWLPQHRNTEADQLARAALGLPPRTPPKPRRRRK